MLRAGKDRATGFSEQTPAHSLPAHQYWTGPNQEAKAAEKELAETAERKTEDLTEEDIAKNLKWHAVGRKGEKKIFKGTRQGEPVGEGPPTVTRGEGVKRKREGRLALNLEENKNGRHGHRGQLPEEGGGGRGSSSESDE